MFRHFILNCFLAGSFHGQESVTYTDKEVMAYLSQHRSNRPLMTILAPKNLLSRHPDLKTALKHNQDKLTTPLDIYQTVIHASSYPAADSPSLSSSPVSTGVSGVSASEGIAAAHAHARGQTKNGDNAVAGVSLLNPISDRSCNEAGLPERSVQCFCNTLHESTPSWTKVDTSTEGGTELWLAVVDTAVTSVNSWARNYPHFCAHLSVETPFTSPTTATTVDSSDINSTNIMNMVVHETDKTRVFYFIVNMGNHTRTQPVTFIFGVEETKTELSKLSSNKKASKASAPNKIEFGGMEVVYQQQVSKYSTFDCDLIALNLAPLSPQTHHSTLLTTQRARQTVGVTQTNKTLQDADGTDQDLGHIEENAEHKSNEHLNGLHQSSSGSLRFVPEEIDYSVCVGIPWYGRWCQAVWYPQGGVLRELDTDDAASCLRKCKQSLGCSYWDWGSTTVSTRHGTATSRNSTMATQLSSRKLQENRYENSKSCRLLSRAGPTVQAATREEKMSGLFGGRSVCSVPKNPESCVVVAAFNNATVCDGA